MENTGKVESQQFCFRIDEPIATFDLYVITRFP